MITVVLATGQQVAVPAGATATVRKLPGTSSDVLACMDLRNQLVAAFKWEQVLGYVITDHLAQHDAGGWPVIAAPPGPATRSERDGDAGSLTGRPPYDVRPTTARPRVPTGEA